MEMKKGYLHLTEKIVLGDGLYPLSGLQKIESNMDTDLRELNELPRSLHINYLEFFKHFLSIYFSATAGYWTCRDEDGGYKGVY